MAILRDPVYLDNSINYVASVAFFCCVSCVTFMLKFGGFKASLNLFSSKKNGGDKYNETDISVTGAYRTNRDEFFGTGRPSDPPRKITPSGAKLNTNEHAAVRPIRAIKSTGNLNIAKAAPTITAAASVSLDPKGEDNVRQENVKEKTNVEKQQKKIEKQRIAEEKVRQKQAAQKQAAQEQAKQEKLRKKAEKKEERCKKKKKKAPQPVHSPQSSATQPQSSNLLGQAPVRYSTNTLESSISRTSGTPPYSEVPKEIQKDVSNNVTFSKPLDTGSWDMISKHRQQIDRPVQTSALKEKRMVMDLNYNFNNNLSVRDDSQNSEA